MFKKFYTGCVEDRNDPLKVGRCKVRIVGLHTEDKNELPTKDLPWAQPVLPITEAGSSGIGKAPVGPVEGTWVLVIFMDVDEQIPIMIGTLTGVSQKEDAFEGGNVQTPLVVNNYQLDGNPTPAANAPVPAATNNAAAGSDKLPAGKVVSTEKVIGPLAKLVKTGETVAGSYDTYTKSTNGPQGTSSVATGSGNVKLSKMTIKEIMEKQSLPAGSPDKLYSVGKYQIDPVSLKNAIQALNIDVNQSFSEATQDLICQEYIVARKRPKLVAYFKTASKTDDKLLQDAGEALAAEFPTYEDPYNPGFPYGGENGNYYKAGYRVATKWDTVKENLLSEWEFRNDPVNPSPTASIADGDKVEKGSDFSGVRKLLPADDSDITPPESSEAAETNVPNEFPNPDILGGLDILGAGNLTNFADLGNAFNAAALTAAGDLNNLGLNDLGKLGDLGSAIGELGISGLGNLDASLLSSITATQTEFANLTKTVNLDGDINKVLTSVTGNATSTLTSYGNNLNDISSNLGIDNPSGTVSGLVANLGLSSADPKLLVKEMEKIAGSTAGQARALLAKLQGEPSKPQAVPMGERRPDGTISNGSLVDPAKGFQDPNGVYPKYQEEQDTNRLASGNNLGRTIVTEKQADLKSGIKIANGGTWNSPPVPYAGVYPYNHVTQYECGHVLEFDNTPQAERINIHHKAGTFIEMDASGTQVNRIMGDGYEIIDRNGYIYIKGACNLTVDGALNVRTDNVFNLEVSGAANINVYNDANINVSGSTNMAVGGEFNLKANKINLESAGQFNLISKTGLNVESGSDLNIKSGGTAFIQTDGNINNKTKGGVFIESGTDTNIKSGGLLNVQSVDNLNIKSDKVLSVESTDNLNLKTAAVGSFGSAGQLNINSGASVAVDGTSIQLNDGASSAPDSAGEAKEAKPARTAVRTNIELPIETRGTSGVSQVANSPLVTRGSEVAFESPEKTPGSDLAAYKADRVAQNQTSKSADAATTFAKDTVKPNAKSASTGKNSDVSAILNMSPDAFNAGMRLSKNFTLGDLTMGGVRIPRRSYQMATGEMLAPQDIVANMKRLCDNVLEPICEMYGRDSFVITSAFRRPSTGPNDGGDLNIKKSDGSYQKEGGDHPAGRAADISFKGGKADTFKKASEIVKKIGSWHQIIMEYNNGGSQFWIHCSYRQQGNQGMMFTMNNHHTVSGTYPKNGFVLV